MDDLLYIIKNQQETISRLSKLVGDAYEADKNDSSEGIITLSTRALSTLNSLPVFLNAYMRNGKTKTALNEDKLETNYIFSLECSDFEMLSEKEVMLTYIKYPALSCEILLFNRYGGKHIKQSSISTTELVNGILGYFEEVQPEKVDILRKHISTKEDRLRFIKSIIYSQKKLKG